MTALAKTDTRIWSDYRILQEAVRHAEHNVSIATDYLSRVASVFPDPTFQERHLLVLAGRMEQLASGLRETLASIEQRRADDAETTARVSAMFAEAAE